MPYYPEKGPETGHEKPATAGTPEGKRGGKPVLIILMLVSLALVIYGGTRLFTYIQELSASRETSHELKQAYDNARQNTDTAETAKMNAGAEETEAESEPGEAASPVPEETEPDPAVTERAGKASLSGKLQPVPYPDNPGLQVSSRFIQLRKKSGYIIGWLSMDGVDEAVVLKDNTFFLNHDAMGRKNSNGAIFLDQDISLLTRPYTVILYGHNMKSGNMFGKLKKYRDISYLYDNMIVSFDSLYEDGEYAIFAVLEFSVLPEKSVWFDMWSLASDDISERESAVRSLEKRSVQGSMLDVQADDQLLLLVTCLDGEDERLMVAARRLRDGETETSLTFRRQ